MAWVSASQSEFEFRARAAAAGNCNDRVSRKDIDMIA
jgi:hypothetical protein